MALRWRLLHHFLGAAALASILLLAELTGLLHWLDVVMLRTVAPQVQEVSREPAAHAPVVVAIDPQAYADDFKLQSPLPREPLTRLLGLVADASPGAVLIDLQLEPMADEAPDRPLDKVLKALALHARVVLPAPEPRTPPLDTRALTWMKDLCGAGVSFGSPELMAQFGTIVRFKESALTLAQQLGHAPSGHAPSLESACERAAAAQSLSLLRMEMEVELAQHHKTQPLNPAYLHAVQHGAVNAHGLLHGQDALRLPPAGTVVLGGTYDVRDRFATPAGEMSGVFVHAAILAGHACENHLAGWVTDLFVGTALGFLFEFLFGLAKRASCWLHTALQSRGTAAGAAWVLHFYGRQSLQMLVWFTPALLALACFRAAGWLMEQGLWLNPGPVIIGMFLHVLLLQRAEHHAVSSLRGFVGQHPASVLFQIPIAIVAPITYVVLHGLPHHC